LACNLSLGFCIRWVLVRPSFAGQVGFTRNIEFRFYPGWQIQFPFHSEHPVSFHPGILADICSFLKILVHFACDSVLSTLLMDHDFLVIAKHHVVGKIFSRRVWYLFSVKSVGVP
jgi:hypothetical protein